MSSGSRVRRSSRTRCSHRGRPSSGSKPAEGSDADQSSWIADDICTRCGALAPHGKLYCSEKCREQDSQNAATLPTKDPKVEELSKALSQLRYPMTLSPHLTAATAGLPMFPKHKASEHQQSLHSPSSSSERRDCGGMPRSPSPSSGSVGSEKSESELTFPSPWQVGLDVSDEQGDISEDDDLTLPPSVMGSTLFATSRSVGTRMYKFKSGSFSTPKGPLWSSPTLAPHSMVTTRSSESPIQFTRMPCSTNIPSSVIYANPMSTGKATLPATLRRLGSDPQSERHSPPPMAKSRSHFSYMSHDHSSDMIPNHPKQMPVQKQEASDQKHHDSDISLRSMDREHRITNQNSPDLCQNCNESITSGTSGHQSNGSSDDPPRGRPLRRTGHSCCSGHRRLDAAACDPYCILSMNRNNKASHAVPSPDLVFPLCPTEPSA